MKPRPFSPSLGSAARGVALTITVRTVPQNGVQSVILGHPIDLHHGSDSLFEGLPADLVSCLSDAKELCKMFRNSCRLTGATRGNILGIEFPGGIPIEMHSPILSPSATPGQWMELETSGPGVSLPGPRHSRTEVRTTQAS